MIKHLLTALALLLLASPAWGKWLIVDENGVVQDIASAKSYLSRGYGFKGAKTLEVPNNLGVAILDRYDGKLVTPYDGTEVERRIEIIDYAISVSRDVNEITDLEAMKTELEK